MTSAAALERSIRRALVKGPRSVIVTVTASPVLRLLTSALLVRGRVKLAAVNARSSNRLPDAVLWQLFAVEAGEAKRRGR